MSAHNVTKSLFLPELKFIKQLRTSRHRDCAFELLKCSSFEVCPNCATKSSSVYDHVYVHVRDVPLRGKQVLNKIKKRRFKCPNCKSIFREPVRGIKKGFRTTERFRRNLMQACSSYETLKQVSKNIIALNGLFINVSMSKLSLKIECIKLLGQRRLELMSIALFATSL